MKLFLLAFLLGAAYAVEEAVAPVADAVAPVAEAVAPVADAIANPVKEAVKPIADAAAPVVGAVADASKAFANVAQAAVDAAGAVIPGAALPAKLAGGVIDMMKGSIDNFKSILSDGDKGLFNPFFNPFFGHKLFKRSSLDLDVSCIDGFNEARVELFNLMSNNAVMDYCQSIDGQANDICNMITEPLTEVLSKTQDLVNMVVKYCQSQNPV
ncbi:hypothetical protein FF38_08178 [Lucilia cuprina]|uniref:Protein TsetseEP domain-containing protein n=1 Tax=Lucilia cuprina TaxID=7375 RepID=A0A0L0C0J0_LUCCU|nr:hypothetical protein CVS40_2156 [Lucilia cuprina]KNC25823.1 hypothetical protein FF38_08178 [Lucilia cuprina]